MYSGTDLGTWAWLMLATAVALFIRHWRDRAGVGVLLTFVVSFSVLHWLAPVMYLLPWYTVSGMDLVADGLREATVAMIAVAVGAEVMLFVLGRRRSLRATESRMPNDRVVDPRAVKLFLGAGALLYVGLFPIAGSLPSVQALLATGSTVIIAALGMKCWNAWQTGRRSALLGWLALTLVLPLITVVTQGFLGYGFAASVTVLAFVASFYRPRWRVILVGVALGYLGLSIYVTYMRDRNEIRAVVWGGAGLGDRTDRLTATISGIEWFDIHDERHLARIDDRLNQDYLVGAAMAHLDSGRVPFAKGGTFIDAALGVIPRALWPNKPNVGGSGDLVTTYTGIRFAEGTSVGIGQLMECYINFGTAGVAGGFFLIGALLVLVDRSAFNALDRGDIKHFALWYVSGLSLLQVGGSLVEVTSTAAAGALMAVLLNHLVGRLHRVEPVHAREAIGAPTHPEVRP